MIPSSLLQTGYLKDAPERSFFISGGGDVAFILGPDRMAVFPTGSRGWQGFPVEGNSAWEGLIFPEFGLALDVDLMVSASRTDVSVGDVAYLEGVPKLLTAGHVNSLGKILWLPMTAATEDPSKTNRNFAFKGWSIFLQDGNDRHILAEVQNGRLTGGLAHKG
jgi:hypothetical protein